MAPRGDDDDFDDLKMIRHAACWCPGAALARTEPDRNARSVHGSLASARRARARPDGSITGAVVRRSNGRLLIVGLAPGLQGANRTGRPFTGDFAGDLLYATLLEYGFAKGKYQARPTTGWTLGDCRIGNAVAGCVPPQTSLCRWRSTPAGSSCQRRLRPCRGCARSCARPGSA